MKRINIDKKHTHFIGCWNIENNKLCDNLIQFFNDNKSLQVQGKTSSGVSIKAKKRTDITITPNNLNNPKFEIFKQYVGELHKCYLDYQSQWPFLKSIFKEVDIQPFNIGKYFPGDHFSPHSERTSLTTLHRLFAWMTYLNDVEEGGQTYFSHFEIKVKPETGKTLIWPAEWTHIHSGEVVKSGNKYMITGHMFLPIPNIN